MHLKSFKEPTLEQLDQIRIHDLGFCFLGNLKNPILQHFQYEIYKTKIFEFCFEKSGKDKVVILDLVTFKATSKQQRKKI